MATSARTVLLALPLSISIISIVPTTAEAERDRGGGGGGGGRLGQVSAGLATATAGGGAPSHPIPSPRPEPAPYVERYHYEDRPEYLGYAPVGIVAATEAGGVATAAPPPKPNPVSVDFYAGAQKVHESDGSVSLELAFNEGRFRLGGSLSRYFERQEGAESLYFTLGALYLGLRIDDGGATRAYLEAGAVGAETDHDPVMDSSIGGVLGGVRVEHRVARHTTLVGDAQAMVFEQDVRAGAVRAGVRFGPVQATLRYLDLNVGPALFGPEVGLRF
jgi:hypothetical protein